MNFMQRIIGLITKPRETMKDIVEHPRIEEAIVVVAVYTVISLVISFISAMSSGQGYGINVLSLIIGLFWPFIAWFIVTGILYGLTVFFGGEGKFSPDLFTGIGYSTEVKIPFVIVSAILILFVPAMAMPSINQAAPTADEMRQLADAMSSYLFNPLFILSYLAGMVGLIWSCYLGMLAVNDAMHVREKTAAIMVGVPAAIYIAGLTALTYGSLYLLRMAAGSLA